MDRNGNPGLGDAPGHLDNMQLLNILREKDSTIEKLKREVWRLLFNNMPC